jgi:prepilin-type N-terminal cleavage/methylation domain-containing protein
MKGAERGYTLLELLLVLLVLGILAAVVVIATTGLIRRGEKQAYDVDQRTIQSAVASFFTDVHRYSWSNGWNENSCDICVQNYPTESGGASKLYPASEVTELDGYSVFEIEGFIGSTPEEKRIEIEEAAIWMGLLVNNPGHGNEGVDIAPGDENSPLEHEYGPYLSTLPDSCSTNNCSYGGGTITWIVGRNGTVYGVYEVDDIWYTGFGGRYT